MRFMFLVMIATAWSSLAFAQSYNWTVKNKWTPAMEKDFSEFVAIIGASKCNTLDSCLRNPVANPLYHKLIPKKAKKTIVIPGLSSKEKKVKKEYGHFYADCADYPYSLRMAFAWFNGLPFDYVKDVSLVDFGNKLKSKKSFTKGKTYDFYKSLNDMNWYYISTRTYRIHYKYNFDFYPTYLTKNNIKPGSVVYDSSGHAAIVYKIEKNGRIKMMDAHPDGSVTRITYDKKFVRSRPAHGVSIGNWRPELNTQPTSDLPGFSAEQFNGIRERKKIPFTINGTKVGYYDYLRTKLAGADLKYNPVTEMKTTIAELCSNIHDRIPSVASAIRNGLDQKKHPRTLPDNIYGTHGEWESYSTPSRDARLKVAFVEMKKDVLDLISRYQNGDPRVVYNPKKSAYSSTCQTDTCYLAGSLLEAYDEMSSSKQCQFKYTNSNGVNVNLGFGQINARLFKMSFDPYHCIERRWGATGSELSTCRESGEKVSWYNEEQPLRNQVERKYDLPMGYGLGELDRIGVPYAPDVDLQGALFDLLY